MDGIPCVPSRSSSSPAGSSVPHPGRTPPGLADRLLRFALGVLVVGCCAAAENDDRAAAKALHTAAQRADEAWTAIQLESWGEANNLRLRPALPGLTVHGGPLFAF